jgi:hypothetical protein
MNSGDGCDFRPEVPDWLWVMYWLALILNGFPTLLFLTALLTRHFRGEYSLYDWAFAFILLPPAGLLISAVVVFQMLRRSRQWAVAALIFVSIIPALFLGALATGGIRLGH